MTCLNVEKLLVLVGIKISLDFNLSAVAYFWGHVACPKFSFIKTIRLEVSRIKSR